MPSVEERAIRRWEVSLSWSMYIEPALLVDIAFWSSCIFACNLLGDNFVVRRYLVGFVVGASLLAFLLVYEVKYQENVFSMHLRKYIRLAASRVISQI